MNQTSISLLAYVLLWTSALIVGSIIFVHIITSSLTAIEIIIDLFKEKK